MTVRGLNRTAAVYAPSEASGRYEPTGTEFACRLTQRGTGGTGPLRAEAASERRLIWGPELELDEHVELAIGPPGQDPGDPGGARWRPRAGTFGAYSRRAGTEVVYRACDVVRQQTG